MGIDQFSSYDCFDKWLGGGQCWSCGVSWGSVVVGVEVGEECEEEVQSSV